jgi:hypothetical protein
MDMAAEHKPSPAKLAGSQLVEMQQTANQLFYSSDHTQHSPDTMSQPQYAPAATAGGQQNGPVSYRPVASRPT